MSKLIFEQFFDPDTSTYTYLVGDNASKEAALIDTVKEHADLYFAKLDSLGLKLVYLLETHVHADHGTANSLLANRFPNAKIAVAHSGVKCEHTPLTDGMLLRVGNIEIKTLFTPGHTSDSVTFLVDGHRLLTGDTLFINSCGRTDFQAGSAVDMYQSLKKLAALPADTLVYPGHDYNSRFVSSIREQLETNKLLKLNEAEFCSELASWKLPPPKRIKESVPANLMCGADKN